MYPCEGCGKKMRTPEQLIRITGRKGEVVDKVYSCNDCREKIEITMQELQREKTKRYTKVVVKHIEKQREKQQAKKKEKEEG